VSLGLRRPDNDVPLVSNDGDAVEDLNPVKSWGQRVGQGGRRLTQTRHQANRSPPFKVPWRPRARITKKGPGVIARSLGGAVLGGGDTWGAPHRSLNKAVPRMFQGSAEVFGHSG
jgi:hypothetical protein